MYRLLHLYAEYGRYITYRRGIPFIYDMLVPVQRRILIVAYDEYKRSKSLVHSASIVGMTLAKYHPHGDQACYEALVKLAKQGYLEDPGCFGSEGLQDTPPAAMRYTATRLKDWVAALCFEYIKHVPTVTLEKEPEPLYLPSPIPLGLIGKGFFHGITFHKTTIPKYTIDDLYKRLLYLLGKGEKYVPKPNLPGCDIEATEEQLEKVFTVGKTDFTIYPHVEKHNKGSLILGKNPLRKFDALIKYCNENKIAIRDLSGKDVEIWVNLDPDTVRSLTKAVAYVDVHVVDNFDYTKPVKIRTVPLDKVLLTAYENWVKIVQKDISDQIKSVEQKINELQYIRKIRDVYRKYKPDSLNALLDVYNKVYPQDNVEVIRDICKRYSISTLLDVAVNLNNWTDKLEQLKNINLGQFCQDKINEYLTIAAGN